MSGDKWKKIINSMLLKENFTKIGYRCMINDQKERKQVI